MPTVYWIQLTLREVIITSYFPIVGATFGQGCYFARDSSISIGIVDGGRFDGSPIRSIMLVKVITGKYCKGYDKMPWSDVLRRGCHSSVDNTVNPVEFIVYHDAAAYPEYVIKYWIDRSRNH